MRTFIQKYTIEVYNTIGGGIVGFVGSKLYEDWIQPILLTCVCAVLSLLISYFGKKLLEKKS